MAGTAFFADAAFFGATFWMGLDGFFTAAFFVDGVFAGDAFFTAAFFASGFAATFLAGLDVGFFFAMAVPF
ncbi:MAG: hypothetical protein IPN44_05325 [Flavobacteriales bacterium]|nr:hypothetical protein [Flavobacteriales bacterium]